jgi:hypothetical protein
MTAIAALVDRMSHTTDEYDIDMQVFEMEVEVDTDGLMGRINARNARYSIDMKNVLIPLRQKAKKMPPRILADVQAIGALVLTLREQVVEAVARTDLSMLLEFMHWAVARVKKIVDDVRALKAAVASSHYRFVVRIR